jgi:hypothetical protein
VVRKTETELNGDVVSSVFFECYRDIRSCNGYLECDVIKVKHTSFSLLGISTRLAINRTIGLPSSCVYPGKSRSTPAQDGRPVTLESVPTVGEVKAVMKLLESAELEHSMLECPGGVSAASMRDVVTIDSASCANALIIARWLLVTASLSCGDESR